MFALIYATLHICLHHSQIWISCNGEGVFLLGKFLNGLLIGYWNR